MPFGKRSEGDDALPDKQASNSKRSTLFGRITSDDSLAVAAAMARGALPAAREPCNATEQVDPVGVDAVGIRPGLRASGSVVD